MDHITLPDLPADMSIIDALDIMQTAKRSGIVTMIAGKKAVIEAKDLLDLAHLADLRIGDVTPARSTGKLPEDPLADYMATEMALDSQNAFFGVMESAGKHIVVVTRHEGIAVELGQPSGFYACTGVRRHRFSSATVPASMICDRGDNATIEWVDP